MKVRGHTLVWHGDNPAWQTGGGYSAAEMSAIVQDHITTVMQHFGSEIFAWDVVNEAFNDDGSMRSTIFYDQPGIGFAGQGTAYIEQSMRWANAANPSAKLFYNDYSAEVVNDKSDAILAMATDFKNRGVPLHEKSYLYPGNVPSTSHFRSSSGAFWLNTIPEKTASHATKIRDLGRLRARRQPDRKHPEIAERDERNRAAVGRHRRRHDALQRLRARRHDVAMRDRVARSSQ
jgi:hypothetical protein